jgi:hypothetical protein
MTFHPLGYFQKLTVILYGKRAQRNGKILGKIWQFFLQFHLNKQFQNINCCWYFKVSKAVWCIYFGLFAWPLFWLLLKKVGRFFQTADHPVQNTSYDVN